MLQLSIFSFGCLRNFPTITPTIEFLRHGDNSYSLIMTFSEEHATRASRSPMGLVESKVASTYPAQSDSGIAAIDSEKLFAVVKITLKQKNK